jgi:hypothetical protein
MLSVAYGRRRKKVLKQLKLAMKDAAKYVEEEQQAIFEKYLTHCAVMIQKSWRGKWARMFTVPRQVHLNRRREAEKQREVMRQ